MAIDEKGEFQELIFNLHERHRDVTEPFVRRLCDLCHEGDGDGVFYLLQSLETLHKMCVEMIRSKETVSKEEWEKKH